MPLIRRVSFLFLWALGVAHAAPGDPIQNNNYQIDLTRTVIAGSTRKIGMGGAFVGLAEGNAAIPDNPAAVAYRPRAFMRPWEFDMVMGTLVTTDDDTDNSGASSALYGDQALVDLGLMAQYKNFGIGFVGQMTVVQSDSLPEDHEAQFLSGTFAVGYTLLEQQLAIGASANPVGARMKETGYPYQTDFKLKGSGWGLGVLWHPHRKNWRFGGSYTSGVSTDQELVQTSTTPISAGSLIVPNGVLTTDMFALGTSYEWNHFPFWRNRPTIANVDVRMFDDSPAGTQGGKAFLTQTEQPIGQKWIATYHAGMEVETMPQFLRLRVGTYHEPSRYDGISARQHITGGFELRLTKFNVWDNRPLAISYAADVAARYQVHSISIWLYTFTVPVPES